MSRYLLLISENPQDRLFATAVARISELELKVCPSAEEAVPIILNEPVAVTMADASSEAQYNQLLDTIQESVGLFSDRINANAIHFISSENIEKVQYLIQSPLFGHFILRNYGDPVAAGTHYGRVVRATLSDRAFGLEKLLPAGSKIQVVKLKMSTQKQDAVEALKNYLVAARFQSRMATVITNALDELLMNAIFDAPVDELGKPVYISTPRNTAFALEKKNSVEMHVGYDGNYVAISAVDLFGSLDKVKLLTHISKIYTAEEYKVKTQVAGAGIGLATVFRSGGSFFFTSESHTRTEVTVFFKRTNNFREFKDQFRFISTQFYF